MSLRTPSSPFLFSCLPFYYSHYFSSPSSLFFLFLASFSLFLSCLLWLLSLFRSQWCVKKPPRVWIRVLVLPCPAVWPWAAHLTNLNLAFSSLKWSAYYLICFLEWVTAKTKWNLRGDSTLAEGAGQFNIEFWSHCLFLWLSPPLLHPLSNLFHFSFNLVFHFPIYPNFTHLYFQTRYSYPLIDG